MCTKFYLLISNWTNFTINVAPTLYYFFCNVLAHVIVIHITVLILAITSF